MTAKRGRLRIRSAAVNPLADVALPVLLILQNAMAVGILAILLHGMAGSPFLPGLSGWALLFGAESMLFTGYFFVRELDMPAALRGVEAAVMLVLAKLVTTAPHTGWGLSALTDWERVEPWAGVLILGWVWFTGLRGAYLCGALHPGLAPDPESEQIQQNDHGEAFEALRSRVLSITAVAAGLTGILPAMAAREGFLMPPAGRWIGPGLVGMALLSGVALLLGARLRQEITWRLERLAPPLGVMSRWAPQALALLLLPLLLAALLPAGPRLPVERLLGQEQPQVREVEIPRPEPPPSPESVERPEWAERLFREAGEMPRWIQQLLVGLLWMVVGGMALALLAVAGKQLAERFGWGEARGIWAVLRMLLSWYRELWQALLDGLRGSAGLLSKAAGEAAGLVFGQAGLLGRYLPAWGRPPGEPRAAVRYYFARLQADAARKGLRRAPGATAAEFGTRLAEAAPDQAAEIGGLTAAYQQARYSPDELPGETVPLARKAWLLISKALGRR